MCNIEFLRNNKKMNNLNIIKVFAANCLLYALENSLSIVHMPLSNIPLVSFTRSSKYLDVVFKASIKSANNASMKFNRHLAK